MTTTLDLRRGSWWLTLSAILLLSLACTGCGSDEAGGGKEARAGTGPADGVKGASLPFVLADGWQVADGLNLLPRRLLATDATDPRWSISGPELDAGATAGERLDARAAAVEEARARGIYPIYDEVLKRERQRADAGYPSSIWLALERPSGTELVYVVPLGVAMPRGSEGGTGAEIYSGLGRLLRYGEGLDGDSFGLAYGKPVEVDGIDWPTGLSPSWTKEADADEQLAGWSGLFNAVAPTVPIREIWCRSTAGGVDVLLVGVGISGRVEFDGPEKVFVANIDTIPSGQELKRMFAAMGIEFSNDPIPHSDK